MLSVFRSTHDCRFLGSTPMALQPLGPSVTLQLSFTLLWLLLGRPVNALSLSLSLSLSRSPLCSFLCVVDVAAVSPASGLPQHLVVDGCFQTFFPASGLPTALVVDGVSSRSSLPQGSHSTCCGWCFQPFFPAFRASTALVVDGVSRRSSLLRMVSPAVLPCFRASTALAVGVVLNLTPFAQL